jgi:hypothetical protein
MALDSKEFTELGDEFALVAQTAVEAGIPDGVLPRARRGWVNVPAGGRVSGVFWGEGPPELVFLHDSGESARLGRRCPGRRPCLGGHRPARPWALRLAPRRAV